MRLVSHTPTPSPTAMANYGTKGERKMDDLVQAMATTELWIELAFVIVFGGGCFACYRAATKAERAGNKRRATILGIASIAILIAGFVIESHFGIFDGDDD